jgi:hypothetical protein
MAPGSVRPSPITRALQSACHTVYRPLPTRHYPIPGSGMAAGAVLAHRGRACENSPMGLRLPDW